MLEERPASRLCFAKPPPLLACAKLVMSCTHAEDSAQLASLKKASELLHVAAESMIISHHHHSFGRLRRSENAIYTRRCQRKRPLTENVHLRFERTQNVGLVQVIRGGDDDGVEPVVLQQLVDVGEHVRNAKPLRQSAGLWPVVVANRDEGGAFDFRQHGQVGELRDGARSDKRYPTFGQRRSLDLDEVAARRRLPSSSQSIRLTVVPG